MGGGSGENTKGMYTCTVTARREEKEGRRECSGRVRGSKEEGR